MFCASSRFPIFAQGKKGNLIALTTSKHRLSNEMTYQVYVAGKGTHCIYCMAQKVQLSTYKQAWQYFISLFLYFLRPGEKASASRHQLPLAAATILLFPFPSFFFSLPCPLNNEVATADAASCTLFYLYLFTFPLSSLEASVVPSWYILHCTMLRP